MATRDDEPRAKVGDQGDFHVSKCAGFYVVGRFLDGGHRNGICLIPAGTGDSAMMRLSVAKRIAQLLNEHGLIDVEGLVL